jgi:hypothetical protein
MVDRRNRVLPDQRLLRHQRAEVAGLGPHVAVGQLEPGAAKASANWSGFSWKRREIFSYSGSKRSERSVVSIRRASVPRRKCVGHVGRRVLGLHCWAPAGLLVSSHSNLKRFSKKWLLHFVGVWLQVTSGPPVMASAPKPVPCLLRQPRPWSDLAAFGFGADERRIARAVGLAEGVAAGDQGDRLLVVHRHAREGLADVARRRARGRDCRWVLRD